MPFVFPEALLDYYPPDSIQLPPKQFARVGGGGDSELRQRPIANALTGLVVGIFTLAVRTVPL